MFEVEILCSGFIPLQENGKFDFNDVILFIDINNSLENSGDVDTGWYNLMTLILLEKVLKKIHFSHFEPKKVMENSIIFYASFEQF